MITVEHLSKRYGTVPVLDDVGMEIQPGSVTALIGANGSGKSTFLSAVGRLISYDKGTVEIAGERLEAWGTRHLARRLSILRQTLRFDLRLTVEELVEFGRFPHNAGSLTAADRTAVDRALWLMDLESYRTASIHEISGGERQRAFIAMVIAQDTDYALFDEPLNNLDMRHSGRVMAALTTLAHREGKAVAVVVHDINMAAAYADTIVALRDGRVVHTGTVDETMKEPVLEKIFGTAFPVVSVGSRPFCIYHHAAPPTG